VVPIGFPETSVKKYRYLLRNNPKEHSSLLLQLDTVVTTSNFYVIYPFKFKIKPYPAKVENMASF
jgi:hypothetical protein